MPRATALVLMALVLVSACGLPGQQGAALPTVVLGQPQPTLSTVQATASGVTASGVVAPLRQARLATPLGDTVKAVHVLDGDAVQAGQLLVELEGEAVRAQAAQAAAALRIAQAQYDALSAGPTPSQVLGAQAAVDGAEASLARLTAGPRPEVVTVAEAALSAAQARLASLRQGANQTTLALAGLDVDQAKNALWGAQASRDGICGNAHNPGYLCEAAEAQVGIAETGVKQAEMRLAQLQQGPTAEAVAQVQAAVVTARAQLALAQSPATEPDLAAARAQVAQARALLDGLKAGATLAQLAGAQAGIEVARAQLAAAESQVKRLTLVAPFDGVAAEVYVGAGEYVQAGQALLMLADVAHLHVETTDLSERDAPRVTIGQTVSVEIAALQQTVQGRVASVSSLADTLGGDVVYTALIELAAMPRGLRAGMTVEVRFRPD